MRVTRRYMATLLLAGMVAGCAVVPKQPKPVPQPTPTPSGTGLPQDQSRHRVALLVPTTGTNGAVGQAIANATTMALLDTNATNLRITTYDTAKGPQEAARLAVRDGNKLILGPLLGDNLVAVQAEARKSGVAVIAFSNDTSVATADSFVMGHIPEQSIARTVKYARSKGARAFAILSPGGEYGTRAEAALAAAVRANGGTLVSTERFNRANTSIVSAAQRLKARGGYDSVLIAEGARLAEQAAAVLNPRGAAGTRILGTELWSGENSVVRAAGMRGAWFSAVSDGRYKRFVDSYRTRFGTQPYRVATLGYDAVLLTLKVARSWKVGQRFPADVLKSPDGFLGLDGAFRFNRNGVVERALEVREIRNGEVVTVSPAPAKF